MSKELMPLLKRRQIVITVCCLDGGSLRVNVIPKKREHAEDDNPALTVPLSFTGSPDELDRELPGHLATFAESVIKTGSNLDELRAEHTAAIKAIEAENRKKLEEKKRLSGNKGTSAPPQTNAPAELKDGKLAFGGKPTAPQAAPATLFDAREKAPESQASSAAPTVSEA